MLLAELCQIEQGLFQSVDKFALVGEGNFNYRRGATKAFVEVLVSRKRSIESLYIENYMG